MNYLMGTDEDFLPRDDNQEEQHDNEQDRRKSTIDPLRHVDDFIGETEVDGVDLTSTDRRKAEVSKKAVLSMIETFLVEKKKEGLSTEEILASLSSGAGNLNREKVMEFISNRKQQLNEIAQQRRKEAIIREQREAEENLLNSVKERADSQLLDDDYEVAGYDGEIDTEAYSKPEFLKLKYTPVAYNPDEFIAEGYTLRTWAESRRKPRLMVALTVTENTNALHLRESLRAIGENMLSMQKAQQRFRGFHKDIWSDVLICVLVDGRMEMDPDVAQWFQEFGLFQEGSMRYSVKAESDQGDEVIRRTKLHLFERTILLNKEAKRKRHRLDTGKSKAAATKVRIPFPPLQMVLGIKEQCSGNLDSHWWFYDAFCALVQPQYVIKLHAGVSPTPKSFLNILSEMATDVKIGAVSTNLSVKDAYLSPFNFVRIGQQFQFQTIDLVEQSFQAAFGLVLNVPDEFCAFRYDAVKGTPLDRYFRPLEENMESIGPFEGNMFHAQSTVLANEVFLKKGKNYTVTHVMGATATVNVSGSLTGFLQEQKHSVNKTLFSRIHVLKNAYRLYTQSSHDTLRRVFIIPFYIMLAILSLVSWVQVAFFGLVVYYTLAQALPLDAIPFVRGSGLPSELFASFLVAYVTGVVVQIIVAVGNKVTHVARIYNVIGVWYTVLSLATFALVALVYGFQSGYLEGVLLLGAIGGIAVVSLLNLQFHHAMMGLPYYLALFPVMVNVLTLYSLANLHDLNFGSITLDDVEMVNSEKRIRKMRSKLGIRYKKYKSEQIEFLAKEQERLSFAASLAKRDAIFAAFRTRVLLMFVITQVITVALVTYFLTPPQFYDVLAYVVSALLAFKAVFAILFTVKILLKRLILAVYMRTGFGLALLIYGEEISLRRKMEAKIKEERDKDTIGQLDAVFGTGPGDNVVFIREGNDNGQGTVRESTAYDRKFLGSSV